MNRQALPKEILVVTEKAITGLHTAIPAAMGCVVATVDGRLLDHWVTNEAEPERIAAMIGSMVALGETIGTEVKIGRSQYVVVHALNGLLLMQRVPAMKDLLVVATLARLNTNLGIVLHETRKAAAAIGEAVDHWLATHSRVTETQK